MVFTFTESAKSGWREESGGLGGGVFDTEPDSKHTDTRRLAKSLCIWQLFGLRAGDPPPEITVSGQKVQNCCETNSFRVGISEGSTKTQQNGSK